MSDLVMSEFSVTRPSLWRFYIAVLFLSAGKAEAGRSMHVTLCDYIMPWDSLSTTQKKSLSQRYQMGCDCKVRGWKAVGVYGLSSKGKKRKKESKKRKWAAVISQLEYTTRHNR